MESDQAVWVPVRTWMVSGRGPRAPPAGAVTVMREASYTATRARFTRLRITRAASQTKPTLQELTVTG